MYGHSGMNGSVNHARVIPLRRTPGPDEGRDAEGRFTQGNAGRPKGSRNTYQRRLAHEWFACFDYDPLLQALLLAKHLEHKLDHEYAQSPHDWLQCARILSEVLRDLIPYVHPRLKAVEYINEPEILDKLRALEDMTDAELEALLAEAQEYIRQHPRP